MQRASAQVNRDNDRGEEHEDFDEDDLARLRGEIPMASKRASANAKDYASRALAMRAAKPTVARDPVEKSRDACLLQING